MHEMVNIMVRNTEKYHVIKKKKKKARWNASIQCWKFLETIEKHHYWENKR